MSPGLFCLPLLVPKARAHLILKVLRDPWNTGVDGDDLEIPMRPRADSRRRPPPALQSQAGFLKN